MKRQMVKIIALAGSFVLLSASYVMAQTCCSGGVPLSSNLGLPPEEGGVLQTSLRYDLNTLQTLKAGSEVLNDDSRDRRTHSVLLQLGYSINERFSIDGLFSWVQQDRTIRQFGNTDFTSTSGVGDAVFLLKYKTLATFQNQTVLTTGLGVKAPLGASDLTRTDGLPIIADLQPGSGAWDAILWGQMVQVLGFRPSMSISGTAVYSIKGENNEYLGSETYEFGNELQLMLGMSDRLLLGNVIIDPSVIFRFRNVARDVFNDQLLPNTGGTWLFVNPGLNYWINSDFSFGVNVALPLVAHVDGTQVSPTYRINTGFFYKIPFKRREPSNIDLHFGN